MNLEFHKALITDAQTIYPMAEALILQYEDDKLIDLSKALAWTKQKIQEEIAQYERILLNGEVVGYFHWIDHGDHWELDDFYILPQHQGKGIGTAALQQKLTRINRSVIVYVFSQNAPAIHLYRKFGFVHDTTVSPTRQILLRNA